MYTVGMENIDPTILNEFLRNNSSESGVPVSLVPESLITMLQTTLLVAAVLFSIFLVLYLFSVIRKWRVDSAILTMQKDVAEIKQALAGKTPRPSTTTIAAQPKPDASDT